MRMAITKRWAGKAFGTNTGNLYLHFEGDDGALVGTLRMNEDGVGIAVYSVTGTFDGTTLSIQGDPQVEIEGVEFGKLEASGKIDTSGNLLGDWQTKIGSGGTFVLLPHAQENGASSEAALRQFHSARHNFGAIEITREQIIETGEKLQVDFPKMIVAVTTVSEKIQYLDDFKSEQFTVNRASIVKLSGQKPDIQGGNQSVTIEFGPSINYAMTQGANEPWVLGALEALKRDLKRFERTYATNFWRWGIGINQVMLLGAIAFLPTLGGLAQRVILLAGVIGLGWMVNRLHEKYIPLAVIHLRTKPPGLLDRIWPSVWSWLIALSAGAAATLLAVYLQGWLRIGGPPSAP
jgi:hypothetical protein